jgi:hypothetical protein
MSLCGTLDPAPAWIKAGRRSGGVQVSSPSEWEAIASNIETTYAITGMAAAADDSARSG